MTRLSGLIAVLMTVLLLLTLNVKKGTIMSVVLLLQSAIAVMLMWSSALAANEPTNCVKVPVFVGEGVANPGSKVVNELRVDNFDCAGWSTDQWICSQYYWEEMVGLKSITLLKPLSRMRESLPLIHSSYSEGVSGGFVKDFVNFETMNANTLFREGVEENPRRRVFYFKLNCPHAFIAVDY